ncbi:sensor histidine kinase [Glutamicibacter sp. PS]|uniref:sensor histidine kinase n=1 Tax=Glutamicibacter TaxID=1742989 RepID=UPI00283F1F62|nr:ATP-binding protein [Glutamicibacter sp. PS]MDR4533864.1 ATP-binding protein [Glutamicibacter sp. PS]
MNDVFSIIIAGLIGLLLGVVGVAAYRYSQSRAAKLPAVDEPVLPEGAAAVLSVIGRAFVILDDVDGVVRANPSSYAYGLVRGHTLVHDQLLDLVRRVRADGVIAEAQFELQRATLGAGQLIVHVRVAPLGDEYILLLADDRTEITRTEAMRNDFVANVSHELKTPVGAISLLAEAITDAADDPVAVRRFSTRMDKESRRLAALVQDIIELSRLQSSDAIVHGHEVNMDSVIAEAVDRNQLLAEEKAIRISVGGSLEAPIHGDADLLMTAVRNLIDNAIRYSPPNTAVGVGLRQRDGYAQISVTDQGPGISLEEQERVFERFYRVDAARSRSTGGTGLGLSIVKHVVANHGGEVTLWSQPGQGSTFTLRLPLVDEEETALSRADSQTTKDKTESASAADREGGRR